MVFGKKGCELSQSEKARLKDALFGDGSEDSSSSISIRAKKRKYFHDVEEDEDALHCHDSDISKAPDGNPSCKDLELQYVEPVIDNANGSVIIPLDVVNRGSLPFSRTLYGFFFEEEEIEFSVVEFHFRKMWKGIEKIMMNDKGFYFFKFKTNEGMLDALEHGPWSISNIPIFLKRWTPGLNLDKSKHDKVKLPVWINVYDIPLELWNKEGLSIIGSILGNPLAVDTCTAKMCMNASGRAGYARVLVDVDVKGNWVDEVSVSVPFGNGYTLSTLRIKYSWKPPKCSICKVFDHTDSNCTHQKLIARDEDNEATDIPNHEVLDIPVPESQCLLTLQVAFHRAIWEEPVIHKVKLPKQSTVGDVLNEIKTKAELSRPDAELRLFQILQHQIHKIFPLTEKIENITWNLHAQEIPEEEKNLGPQNRLISVYHFTIEAAQNQMEVQNFGKPFLLVIHEKETLAAIKVRIQKKLWIPDEKFSKWKFAFVSRGRPKYLQDSDIVSTRFQRRDDGAWKQCLGLEHSDTTQVWRPW